MFFTPVKAEKERFTFLVSRSLRNLNFENITSFGRLRQKLARKACRTCSTIIFPRWTNQIIDLWRFLNSIISYQGRSQDFSKGGHTVSKWGYSPDCHYGQGIVMAFLPPVVGCSVKKGLQKGGSRAPQDPPLATPLPTAQWWAYELQWCSNRKATGFFRVSPKRKLANWSLHQKPLTISIARWQAYMRH